jgi:hypothetical protein
MSLEQFPVPSKRFFRPRAFATTSPPPIIIIEFLPTSTASGLDLDVDCARSRLPQRSAVRYPVWSHPAWAQTNSARGLCSSSRRKAAML